ncbi:DoxX family protein [Vibrio sp. T187]|uniref:DoxX family protein n=1 Tax=Vibrio TaxID=662 RepID=UPI0010C9548E|nr:MULTISPECIES: DoxX family protein [Vibrio]MBW3695883.1 DoxX family protein [Vibrio sp. T187]
MKITWNDSLLVVARILLAYLFIQAGWGKLLNYEQTANYMATQGVTGALLPLVILLEFFGGLAILVGFLTRVTALTITAFSVISGLMFHFDLSQSGQMIHFYKNLSLAGGFLVLAVHGGGGMSVDHWLQNRFSFYKGRFINSL